ncbi:MAG TPA: hypothetical protein VG406_27785 [Isosphaeraceae bacterium]|jgi:dipeptidyl aminopeptidase/acylaminoacyl peptidase|nr:hypothetical protein [Isosphaeraceae bacterium]
MRTISDRITRRDALARIAGGAALAVSATSRAASDDDDGKRPPARIYVSTPGRAGDPEAGARGILAIDPKDGTWTQVAPAPFLRARVAPEGRGIACTRNDGTGGLWVFEVGGEAPRRINREPAYAFWSPDGKRLTFTTKSRDGVVKSWRMNRDGTDRVELPLPDGEAIVDWSPDGEWFLTRWTKAEDAVLEQARYPFGLIHPDGTNRRLLISPERATGYHRFAPDGRSVLFTSYVWVPRVGAGAPFRIERIGVVGQGRKTILEQDGREGPYQAVWSPDGKELAVLYLNNGRDEGEDIATRLVIVDADGRRSRRLDTLGGGNFILDDWR